MGRYDYRTEHFQKVSVCGIRCEFSDIRIDRSTVPEEKYQYEVAGIMTAAVIRQGSGRGSWSISLTRSSVTSRFQLKMMVYYGWGMVILYGCRDL